jgi:hypothetical protein
MMFVPMVVPLFLASIPQLPITTSTLTTSSITTSLDHLHHSQRLRRLTLL